MTPPETAAKFLATLRQIHRFEEAIPEDCRPLDTSEGYAIQNALIALLLDDNGGDRIGYKVACTNRYAQELLNVNAPFFGQLLTASSHSAPVHLPASAFAHRLMEPEFAFEMAADVPASDTPYTATSIAPYIATLVPAIEIVDWHFTNWGTVGTPSLIADNAIHGAWAYGNPISGWQSIDLAHHEVRLIVNGEIMGQGTGANVLGHPLNVMAWLATELPKWGDQLKAGDRVTTGVCTQVYDAQAGDTIRANFGILGTVDLSFDA